MGTPAASGCPRRVRCPRPLADARARVCLEFDLPEYAMSERLRFFQCLAWRGRRSLDFVDGGFLVLARFAFVARECDYALPGVPIEFSYRRSGRVDAFGVGDVLHGVAPRSKGCRVFMLARPS